MQVSAQEKQKPSPVLSFDHVSKVYELNASFFSRKDKVVKAVSDVTFTLDAGSTYGIVGESGSGKTTSARMAVLMERPTTGTITYYGEGEGRDITKLDKRSLRSYREKIKYIFQDPAKSLDARMSVIDILTIALRHSSLYRGKLDAKKRAIRALESVGLSEKDSEKRPVDFSGGQRQRISIARALVMEPKVLICDEVVSALDVSLQGQVINLLVSLKKSLGLSYIFITHDLRVASYFCDKIGVMCKGKIIEEGGADLYKNCTCDYTKALFNSSSYASLAGGASL